MLAESAPSVTGTECPEWIALDGGRVRRIYRANLEGNPTQAVARRFGKAHRTAGLYIARARAKGLLGPTTPGKAGEGA